jgi:hypothetical protein
MLQISEPDIKARVERDNPWWASPAGVIPEADHLRRVYFEPFRRLALDYTVRRAAILLGPL